MAPVGALRRAYRARVRSLALAALVYYATVCFATIYDPWHGRYFLVAALLAFPAVAAFLERERRRALGAFVACAVAVGCASADAALLFREHAALLRACYGDQSVGSVFAMDRAAQLTSHIPRYAPALRAFEAIVPPDATGAIYGDNMFEYVFFGREMRRRRTPLGAGDAPMRPPPPGTEFLVFASEALAPADGDLHLGENWYLRRLAREGP
jgi:hypothetical protein